MFRLKYKILSHLSPAKLKHIFESCKSITQIMPQSDGFRTRGLEPPCMTALLRTRGTGTKNGQADYIAPLQPVTLASVKTWGIRGELAV